ncbi:hypothetical protein ACO2Q1_00565 [Brevundimonas sp. VNH65]|uniref:hypothetical protein n=1 Tax=Brevundimonas sp. VNH65 TaxID=3400917 RepID=UPI003C06FCEB
MEEAHRIHKDVAWGWVAALQPLPAALGRAIRGVLPPRDRVTTPWSLRASRDWTA